MNYTKSYIFCVIILSLIVISSGKNERRKENKEKGFYNHTGCLYAYLEGGEFAMITANGDIVEEVLSLDFMEYDSVRSKCTNENEPGKIVFSFAFNETNMENEREIKSITVAMRIAPSLSEGYWEIDQANLTVYRDSNKKRTFRLGISNMDAALTHSYSCNQLTLQTLHKKKTDNDTGRVEPRSEITLRRFQLQPFPELKRVVFAPSFDCSPWFTIPGIMGLVLILFITLITMIAVVFLLNIDTNDFKFSKEGLLFTQSQVESSKQQ